MKAVGNSLIVRLCLPQFAVGLFTTMLNNYLIYFYQPSKASGIPDLIPQGRLVLGILTIIGTIKAIGHIIDAVTDPLIAAGSDKSKHRDGRRIPMMKKAAIPFGLCALLIFFVTGSALGYVSPLIVSAFKGAGMETLSAWRTTFGIYTFIGIILLLIPAYTIREKDYVHSIIPNVTLVESLRHAFSNRHFRLVTLGQLLENTGMAFFQACIMYYVTSLMGLAETYSVLILAISIAGSLLMYPFVNRFAKKRGKKLPILLGCTVFSAAEIVICFSDKLPGNRLVLACVFALFVSFPFAVLNVLPGAMMADIIQYDTVTTGVNQEGIFGAARSFIVKMGNSLAIMIVPSLIVTGAAAGENVGVLGLKLTAVAGSLFCILAIFAFLRYRESEVLAVIAGNGKEGEAL